MYLFSYTFIGNCIFSCILLFSFDLKRVFLQESRTRLSFNVFNVGIPNYPEGVMYTVLIRLNAAASNGLSVFWMQQWSCVI